MRINKRNTRPSLQQGRAAHRPDGQRTELGDGPSVTRYREALPRFDPIDDLTAAVAQIANRDFCHEPTVSRVRRRGDHGSRMEPSSASLRSGWGATSHP